MELKPWEQYNKATYMSGCSLFNYFMVMLWKIITSNLQVICYFFMLLGLMMNGGLLYMVYPFLVFGIALVNEERPS